MVTYVFNDTRTLSSGTTLYSAGSGDEIFLGSNAFWVASLNTARIMALAGGNAIRVSGQVYANQQAFVSTSGSNTITVTATGIVASAGATAIELFGGVNFVLNAGDISGTTGIALSGGSGGVINTGTVFGTGDAIRFSANGGSLESLVNGGTIVSTFDDGIEFSAEGARTVTNSGVIHAFRSTAINDLSTTAASTLTLTNTGTIVGLEAILGSSGLDTIVNSGAITGTVRLRGGDDLFDTSQGIVNGRISGEAGDDTLVGSAIGDRLDGGSGDDTLTANAGDDQLTGATGADELDGGAGIDAAVYLTAVIADLVDPTRNAGEAAGDFYISIETLIGSSSDDQLYGDAARNRLRGNVGDDVLDGRGGADVLIGNAGNDQFVVDDARDRIVELANEGDDSVLTAISFTLPDFVENLTLTGTAASAATGNAIGNILRGNAGANILDGGLGADILSGGAGADQFRFTTALDGIGNVDDILDFLPGTDRIALSRAIFNPLGGGSGGVAAAAFVTGTIAADANDRIIYDRATGSLFFDPDGTGVATQTLFARVDAGTVLASTDFLLFG